MRSPLFILLTVFLVNVHAQSPSPLTISLSPFITGLSSPVGIYHCNDSRLFILEQSQGDIEIYNESGGYIGRFLDLTGIISTGSERGLLGLAFHPDYQNNGQFYVNYTNTQGNTVIARYNRSASDPNLADPGTAQIILTINQPFSNHNGGHIAFGPDGYLYIGMGDGGSANDPGNRSQNIQELLGKMLRIDVDNGEPYSSPSSNPFFGSIAGLDQIWATGLRNPWKFSFDALTGDLWIADVGQNEWEEVNFQPAVSTGGENYGWRCYEANELFNGTGCSGQSAYTFPVFEASHNAPDQWCSITGGYVYRGNDFPYMQGYYLFTDYCAGDFRAISMDDGFNVSTVLDNQGFGFVAFGENQNQELFVANINGTVYRIEDTCGSDLATISAENNSLITNGEGEVYWFQDDMLLSESGNTYTPQSSGNYYAVVEMTNGCFRKSNSVEWVVLSGIPGCTYANASNYNSEAIVDDGSCVFVSSCPADINLDGSVNSGDLLDFLGSYGTTCPD